MAHQHSGTQAGEEHVQCVAITVARAGCEEQLGAAMAALQPKTQAEDGNIRYQLHRDLDEPRRFIILEEWRDRTTFGRHCVAPHIQRYEKDAADWIESASYHPMTLVA